MIGILSEYFQNLKTDRESKENIFQYALSMNVKVKLQMLHIYGTITETQFYNI